MTPPSACTVDANVVVAAARDGEAHHGDSRRVLARLFHEIIPIYCPALLLPEVIAAIARPTGDPGLALEAATRLRALPGLSLVVMDEELSWAAGRFAADLRLRGADAVYLAVAKRHNATLITWDTEMLQRGPAVLPTLTPTGWLAENP